MRLGNNLFDVNRTCRLLRHHDGPFGFIWLHPVGIRGICDASKLKNISHKDHEDRHDQIKWLEAFEAEKKTYEPSVLCTTHTLLASWWRH